MAFVDDFVHELAARVAGIRASDLSATTVEVLQRRFFDLSGATAAGLQTAETRATLAVLRRMQSTSAGVPSETPAYLIAAFTAAARSTEVDDIHLASCTTPGSVVFPAALIGGSIAGADAGAMATSIIAGYEVMTALGIALDGATAIYGTRWPTYFGAAMTAAATVAVTLQLSEERILTALAIAASMTTSYAGRIATDPISRWLTIAYAAQAGLASALASAEGLHGDASMFSACLGLDDTHVARARRPFDRTALERTSSKPFCTGRQSLSAVEAFRQIVREHHIEPAAVERIEVLVPEAYRAMIDRAPRPRTKSESRGVRYQLALAALYPADLFDIDRATLRLDDAGVLHLVDRVEVRASDALSRLYPEQWPAAVRVTTANATHEAEVLAPAGDPGHALSWSAIEEKLVAVAMHMPRGIPVVDLLDDARTMDFKSGLEHLIPYAV